MNEPTTPLLAGVGYERRDLDAMVALLRTHHIDTVADVRTTARSRMPDFARSRLEAGLTANGIDYVHLRGLGNPRENRDGVRAGDPDALARYEAVLDDDDGRALVAQVVAMAQSGRVALLCYERDGSTCHRRMVLTAARDLEPGLEITALGDAAA